MSRPSNLVVAQSGGPSPVINNSLRGIVEAARGLDAIGTVYGARHGIEGVLKEELIDLSAQSPEEIALLRYTPAAGSIGTCRYKLEASQTEDFERVIENVNQHGSGVRIYVFISGFAMINPQTGGCPHVLAEEIFQRILYVTILVAEVV